jgi:UDP-N-acetylglucosamine 2-epimerase (non-hydrolysing)
LAPLINELRKYPNDFEIGVYVTGQHREMLDQVLDVFEITPDYDFRLMTINQDLAAIFTDILLAVNERVVTEKPDLVLVHGDTTTSVACALACFFAHIPVGHVESGLRTYDLTSPFPEELNRQIVGKIALLHFAPTANSKDNLLREGVSAESIFLTGNTVIDSLEYILEKINSDTSLNRNLVSDLDKILNFAWLSNKYILITGHRRESFGAGLEHICRSIESLSRRFPSVHFVYPVHLNPNVLIPVTNYLGKLDNVHLIEPQNYLHFLLLLKNCYFVMSDSGGLQEEAPSFKKPLLLMRDSTERPEAIEIGAAVMVGSSYEAILSVASRLIEDDIYYQSMSVDKNPFGDGMAAKRIVDEIKKYSLKHLNISNTHNVE